MTAPSWSMLLIPVSAEWSSIVAYLVADATVAAWHSTVAAWYSAVTAWHSTESTCNGSRIIADSAETAVRTPEGSLEAGIGAPTNPGKPPIPSCGAGNDDASAMAQAKMNWKNAFRLNSKYFRHAGSSPLTKNLNILLIVIQSKHQNENPRTPPVANQTSIGCYCVCIELLYLREILSFAAREYVNSGRSADVIMHTWMCMWLSVRDAMRKIWTSE